VDEFGECPVVVFPQRVADAGVPVFSKPLRRGVGLIYVGGINEKFRVYVIGVGFDESVERFPTPVVLLLTHVHTPGFECN